MRQETDTMKTVYFLGAGASAASNDNIINNDEQLKEKLEQISNVRLGSCINNKDLGGNPLKRVIPQTPFLKFSTLPLDYPPQSGHSYGRWGFGNGWKEKKNNMVRQQSPNGRRNIAFSYDNQGKK